MLRGLDGYLLIPLFGLANFAVFKLRRGRAGGLSPFSVVIARGRHLFPFRTEQLSPSAPMVLGPRGPGRVGRRRITSTAAGPSFGAARRRLGEHHERPLTISAMSVLAIVLIVVTALALVFLVGGFVVARRRANRPGREEHIRQADHALEQARAADRGWDRDLIESTAREALRSS